MDLIRLKSFTVLAEKLHFGKASQLLNLSQPALSKQIRYLEDEIGGALFSRGRHGAELTELGKMFADEARALIRQADLALERGQRAARGEIGTLSIGFGTSTLTLVPHLISQFRKLSPDVEIKLRNMSTLGQIEALHSGHIHLGFVRLPAGNVFNQLHIHDERLVLIVPTSQYKNNHKVTLTSVKNSPFIMLSQNLSPSLYDHVLRLCGKHGFHPRVEQIANESPTILALVAAGLGVSLVPESQLRTPVEGVTIIKIKDDSARWQVGAAWRKDSNNPKIEIFLKILRAELSPKH